MQTSQKKNYTCITHLEMNRGRVAAQAFAAMLIRVAYGVHDNPAPTAKSVDSQRWLPTSGAIADHKSENDLRIVAVGPFSQASGEFSHFPSHPVT